MHGTIATRNFPINIAKTLLTLKIGGSSPIGKDGAGCLVIFKLEEGLKGLVVSVEVEEELGERAMVSSYVKKKGV